MRPFSEEHKQEIETLDSIMLLDEHPNLRRARSCLVAELEMPRTKMLLDDINEAIVYKDQVVWYCDR